MLGKLRRRMLLSLAFGIVVVLVLGAYADYRAIIGVLRQFDWAVLPVVLLLTAFNYFGRFLKWQFYLSRIASRVPTDASLLIFISGFSMVLTPGKVGELLKSYLLKQVSGTPMARSAPIVLAERLTDGVALLLLGSVGLLLYRRGWEALVAIFALAVLIVLVIQSQPLSMAILARLERLPVLSRLTVHLRAAYASSYLLLRLDALLIAIGLGILSWSGECLAFYVILHGLHLDQNGAGGVLLLVKAAFILASSTLVGSASLLPGGLGVADGGIAGLLHVMLGTPPDVSVAATLLIRFCTLWFGVALGAGALALFGQRYGKLPVQLEGSAAGMKLDMHGHTYWSKDSQLALADLEQAILRAGLDAVCITDHNEIGGALELAARGKVRVIPGEEVYTSEGEIIGLFLKEKIPARLSPQETIAAIREQGGIVYMPHPFDRFRGSRLRPAALAAVLDQVDVLEVFNARNLLAGDNTRAARLARERGLRSGAGSDSHTAYEVGHAYVEIADFGSSAELLTALESAVVHGRRTGPLVHARTRIDKAMKRRGGTGRN